MPLILPDTAEVRTGTGVSALLNGKQHAAMLVWQRMSTPSNSTTNFVHLSGGTATPRWLTSRHVSGGSRQHGFLLNNGSSQTIVAGVSWGTWAALSIWSSADEAAGDLVYGINGGEQYVKGSAAAALETQTTVLRSIGRQMADGSSSLVAHAVIWASDLLGAIPTRAELNAVAAATASLPTLIAAKAPSFYAPLDNPDDGQGGLADLSGNGNHFAEYAAGWSVTADGGPDVGELEPEDGAAQFTAPRWAAVRAVGAARLRA